MDSLVRNWEKSSSASQLGHQLPTPGPSLVHLKVVGRGAHLAQQLGVQMAAAALLQHGRDHVAPGGRQDAVEAVVAKLVGLCSAVRQVVPKSQSKHLEKGGGAQICTHTRRPGDLHFHCPT